MNRNTKQTITAGILVLSLATSLAQGYNADAASAKINRKKVTLSRGKCYTLKVKGCSGKVTWKSSNKKVATVSKKGKVTAKKAGTAKITATVKAKKFTCRIIVRKPSCGNGTASQKPSSTQMPSATQKPLPTQVPATQKPSSPSVSQTPAGSVTEESAYATLNSLRSTYPEGMTLTNSYYYYSPRFGNGYGCYGFAAKLSDTVFGTEKAYTTHSSFDKIKVGDNIRIGNSHSVIVLTKSSNFITVVEGNYNSRVHWDRKITASSLAGSGFKVYTRY